MPALVVLIYAALVLLLAILGRRSWLGFGGVLALSIILTPLVTALLLQLTHRRKRSAAR